MKKIIFLSFLLSCLIFTACQKQPKSKFTIKQTAAKTGLPVKFYNYSENAESYVWDFGDGTQSTEENPIHFYDKEGSYTIKLDAISKNKKKIQSSTKTLTVELNLPFGFSYMPSIVFVGEPVTFKAEGISTYNLEWNFELGNSSTDINPIYTFSNIGNYDVSLTEGNKKITENVTVTNAASSFGGSYNVEELLGGFTYNYYVDAVVSSSTNNKVTILNFGDLMNCNVYFFINGSTITIPSQSTTGGFSSTVRQFSGSGTVVNANSFTINYTQIFDGISINGTQTYSR